MITEDEPAYTSYARMKVREQIRAREIPDPHLVTLASRQRERGDTWTLEQEYAQCKRFRREKWLRRWLPFLASGNERSHPAADESDR